MNLFDQLCIKSDTCGMWVCDGVNECKHAVPKTAVLAPQATNSAMDAMQRISAAWLRSGPGYEFNEVVRNEVTLFRVAQHQ